MNIEEQVRDWLLRWQELINDQNFDEARKLFSNDVIAFGSFSTAMVGLQDLETSQWRNVWGHTRDFQFASDPHIIDLGEGVAIALTWSSLGKKSGSQDTYHRAGRCTMVLRRSANGLVCCHSHFSMNPGSAPLQD